MEFAKYKKPWWKNKAFVLGALAVVWAAALLLVALPAWQQSLVHHREIAELEKGLAELDSWTVAGKWLEISQAETSSKIDQAWRQAFPSQRNREQLFLDLARVADGSGVGNFNLEETPTDDLAAFLVSPPEQSLFGGSVYGVPVQVPKVELKTYRVKASFTGNYRQAASFMGGLQVIDRALSVHDLVVRPSGDKIQVDLELDIYVSQSS